MSTGVHTGTRCVEVYNLEGQIGQGTYGSVYSATSKYRPGKFALKRIHPSKSSNSLSLSFYREIVVLRQITHQNLVPLLEIVSSKFSVGSGSGSGTAEMGLASPTTTITTTATTTIAAALLDTFIRGCIAHR